MHGNLVVAVKSAEGLPTSKKEYGECTQYKSKNCSGDYSSQLLISVTVRLRVAVFQSDCAQ
jgi:hypothetical protein